MYIYQHFVTSIQSHSEVSLSFFFLLFFYIPSVKPLKQAEIIV